GERHGDAVTGRQGRVRRHRVQLPGTAAGQEDVAGPDDHRLAARPLGWDGHHPGRPSALRVYGEGHPPLAYGDTGMAGGGGHQRPLHLVAGASPPAWTTRASEWPP